MKSRKQQQQKNSTLQYSKTLNLFLQIIFEFIFVIYPLEGSSYQESTVFLIVSIIHDLVLVLSVLMWRNELYITFTWAGLRTTVFPAANRGEIFHASIISG